MRRVDMVRAALVSVAVLASVTALGAHELGTTQVSVVFQREAHFEVAIVTDAAALAEKLEAAAGAATGAGQTAGELVRRLEARRDVFLKRIAATFDGVAAQPTVAFAVSEGTALDPPAATVRLTGVRPAAASTFRWSYGWTFTAYAFRVAHPAARQPATVWLDGGATSEPFQLEAPRSPPGRFEILRQYLVLGFTHIVPGGLDHVLFVLGIFLLSQRPRQIVTQVTAFTIAHSLTLALALYGLISIPSRIIEPLIAISIAYVAVENILFADLQRWRVALVFGFGLLHGLGFAGVLTGLGLPPSEFVTALAGFNLGVEAGQLAVIATAFLLVGWSWAPRPWYRTRVVIPASAVIACTAFYWTIVRL